MRKILCLCEFDPAGVILGHRDLLKKVGVDFRVAINHVFVPLHLGADWYFETSDVYGNKIPNKDLNLESLKDFAAVADTIIICPGLGQPWADQTEVRPGSHLDAPTVRYFGIDWRQAGLFSPDRRLIAYIHGSVNTWEHRKEYKSFYSSLGFELATSTLDYSVEMDAVYLPPWIDHQQFGPVVPLRSETDPLVIAHTPTNPRIAHTDAFLSGMLEMGIPVRFATQQTHDHVIEQKKESNTGFDHLRGSFSVNTLENCSLGLVPLVGLKPQYRERLLKSGFQDFPGPSIVSFKDLITTVGDLWWDWELTRQHQLAAKEWVTNNFSSDKITEVLCKFYGVNQ